MMSVCTGQSSADGTRPAAAHREAHPTQERRPTRLAAPGNLAKAATWRNAVMRRYGRTDPVQIAEIVCI